MGEVGTAVIISTSRATVALVTWLTASWRSWDVAGLRRKSMGPWPADLGPSLDSIWLAVWPWPAKLDWRISLPTLCGPCAAQMRKAQKTASPSPSFQRMLQGGLGQCSQQCGPSGRHFSFLMLLLCSLGMSHDLWPTTAHQFVAPQWHVKPLGKKPVLTGGSLFMLLGFI